ncbi:MAG: TRAP transporter substrate-binding protein [Alcaligenaceae bacterium]|nr:TRAP transporter substrate-binding protein [Alcaligenaceae bacterium]
MTCRTLKLVKTLLAAGVLTFSTVAAVQAEPITVRLGHVGEPGSLMEKTANEFAKRANAELGDKAVIQTFGSSQLGKDTEMLRKLKLGTIDLALPSTVMSSVDPAYALYEMPFLFKDREQVAKMQNDPLIRGTMTEAAKKQGYVLLAFWENGFRNITNNERPINKPADLEGIKLRVPNGEWRVRMFKAYHANPTPLAYSETFVGLQTGTVDGQENPLAQIYPAHFYEVQKYLSLTGHVYTPVSVLAGASWKRLPKDVQDIIEKIAMDMQPVALQYGAEMDKDLLGKLKEKGMIVNTADKQAFINDPGTAAIYKLFQDSVPNGKELVERVKELGK